MIVRRERPADHDTVRDLHRAAFAPPGGGEAVEARLTDELRQDAGFLHASPSSRSTRTKSSGT